MGMMILWTWANEMKSLEGHDGVHLGWGIRFQYGREGFLMNPFWTSRNLVQ